MSSPAPARHSLVEAGGWPFLVTAFVGRLPSSMVQLGYLVVLSQDGRGAATAGLAVAAVGLGSALAAPVLGRQVDRIGPLRVVGAATALSLLGQLGFLLSLLRHAPSPWLLACAFVVGVANPQVGPVARSHWSHLAARLRAPWLVSRALGYEGAVDEIGFVVGPVLASLLVSVFGAAPAVVAMMLLTLVLQGLFVVHLARHRDEWAAAGPAASGAARRGAVGSQVLWPVLGCLGVGILFGSTQTALSEVFRLRDTPGLTGVVYGCVGVGSGVASLLVGRSSDRYPVPVRVATGGLLVALGGAFLLTLPSVWPAALAATVLGLGAGLVLVSSFTWMERLAPRDRVATMMTVLATCLTLGVSVGAAAAGRLAAEPSHGFWPLLVTAVLAWVAAAGMRGARGRG